MKLLFIYGPPAAGKLTVAKEVAALTGFKVFHNHLTLDLYESIFEYGTDLFRRLVDDLRVAVLEEAAKQNVPGVIFTFVYGRGVDEPFIQRVVEAIAKYGGEANFVQLYCQPATLQQRVVAESRKAFRKISSVAVLQQVSEEYDLFSPVPGQESLSIDNTNISPEEAAERIITHYSLS